VGPESDDRRFFGRKRSGGRRRVSADRARIRRGGFDPDPVKRLWRVWVSAGLRPRVPAGPVRSDAFQDLLPYTFLGPIARTVSDAALMIEAISGPDTADPNGLPTPTGSYRDAVESAP